MSFRRSATSTTAWSRPVILYRQGTSTRCVTRTWSPTRSGRCAELYEALNLGGFEAVRPRLEVYCQEQASYRTNRYPHLSDERIATIARRWAAVIQRYGYARPAASPARHASEGV